MYYLTWSDKYSVNIKEIDEQHKKLLEIFNILFKEMIAGRGITILGTLLDNLIEFATLHFETEEKYMREYEYPEYEEHKKEHDALKQKAAEIRERLLNQELAPLTVHALELLKEWINKHLLEMDHKYIKFFNQKGLS